MSFSFNNKVDLKTKQQSRIISISPQIKMSSNGFHKTIPIAPPPTFLTIKEDPIDFVLVWDGSNSKTRGTKSLERRKIFEANLEQEGLELERHIVKAKNLNFVIIRAPLEVLKRYGEILKFRMPIKEVSIITFSCCVQVFLDNEHQ